MAILQRPAHEEVTARESGPGERWEEIPKVCRCGVPLPYGFAHHVEELLAQQYRYGARYGYQVGYQACKDGEQHRNPWTDPAPQEPEPQVTTSEGYPEWELVEFNQYGITVIEHGQPAQPTLVLEAQDPALQPLVLRFGRGTATLSLHRADTLQSATGPHRIRWTAHPGGR